MRKGLLLTASTLLIMTGCSDLETHHSVAQMQVRRRLGLVPSGGSSHRMRWRES